MFVPFALGYFLSYLFRVVNAVIAPDLVRDLGLAVDDLGLLTSAYFLAFAALQLPLGILLDRFGPRRTEALLLLLAASGAAVFAHARSGVGLILGRALIGAGVSACLMAAFKAYVLWFPRERLPVVNGWQMAAGGLGAIAATIPVEAALQLTDWRGLFSLLCLATLAVALLLLWVVPEHLRIAADRSWGSELRGIAAVFASGLFWRAAPLTVLSQASFLSIQGLWAGPWLRDVARLDRGGVATHLLAVAGAMVAGFLLLGWGAGRSPRHGLDPLRFAVVGMGCFMLAQLWLLANPHAPPLWGWLAFGFFGTSGILPYAALSQRFPPGLAGRLNTGLNVLVFLLAFAGQWGIGGVIALWGEGPGGGYDPSAYRAAFGLVLGLQALGLAWFVLFRCEGVPPGWIEAGDPPVLTPTGAARDRRGNRSSWRAWGSRTRGP